MEITVNEFESFTTTDLSGDQHSGFAMKTFNAPGGDDDDDTSATDDDNPPVDDDVVHSPLPTQPGKPRRQ